MSKIIPRSSPIAAPGIEYYQTVEDNQTAALIEVFEGEDNDTSKNLFLGDFRILLPKKKAGEAKIKVKFEIDEYSLLKVTAIEKDNENNSIEKLYAIDAYNANYENIKKFESNNLEIIEPKNIGQIIDNLTINNIKILKFTNVGEDIIEKEDKVWEFSKRVNRINEEIKSLKAEKKVEDNKDKIKEKEDKILKLENQRDDNNNTVKNLKREILQILANYGCKLLKRIHEMEEFNRLEKINIELNMFFSFVKYFSKKVNEYFRDYVGENENDGNKNINNGIKEKLNIFLNKIQYDNMNIIYEIFDFCEYDNQEIFDLYLSFLINNYDGKLNERFHSKDVNSEDLKNFEYIVNRCLFLLGKIKVLPKSLLNKENYFKFFKIKIKAKKIILLKTSSENIDNIIKEYEYSLFLDTNDTIDLDYLKKIKDVNLSKESSFKSKEKLFLKKLEAFYDNDEWKNYENFIYILEEYPPNELPKEYERYGRDYYILVKTIFFIEISVNNFYKKMSDAYNNMDINEKSENKKYIYKEIRKFFDYARKKYK